MHRLQKVPAKWVLRKKHSTVGPCGRLQPASRRRSLGIDRLSFHRGPGQLSVGARCWELTVATVGMTMVLEQNSVPCRQGADLMGCSSRALSFFVFEKRGGERVRIESSARAV